MAIVELRNAEVTRIIEGYGAVVTESYKDKNGETRKSYFTVWTKEKLDLGEVVNVKGILSVRLNSYEKNGRMESNAESSINNAKIQRADLEF